MYPRSAAARPKSSPIINHGLGYASQIPPVRGGNKENASHEKSTSAARAPHQQQPQHTAAVLADTLDYTAVSMHDQDLRGAVMTPASLLTALDAKNDDMYYHLWIAARQAVDEFQARGRRGDIRRLTQDAMERLIVEAACALHERLGGTGRVIAFVDPRRYDDAQAMKSSARRLLRLFRARGLGLGSVLISIPATEEGISASRELAAQGIRTNLTLVAGLMHAAVCAEAGATAVTIAVGPLLLAHERRRDAVFPDITMHPGIEIIQAIQLYFSLHNLAPRLVGRDFRKLCELHALPGFDAICLTEAQLDAPRWKTEARSGGGGGGARRLLHEAPSAAMRAQQAQYPTAFLAHTRMTTPGGAGPAGFMTLLSAAARQALVDAMYPALEQMEIKMNVIERMVQEEVAWQLPVKRALGTVSFRELEVGLRQGRRLQTGPPPAPDGTGGDSNRPGESDQEKRTKKDTDTASNNSRKPLGDRENVDEIEYF